jgi:hypothetical protein
MYGRRNRTMPEAQTPVLEDMLTVEFAFARFTGI